jgi:aarF domain-containing kinase
MTFVLRRARLSMLYGSRPIALGRRSSTWSHQRFPAFFTSVPLSRPFPRARVLWIVALSGCAALYLSPAPKSLLRELISSPTVIPCRPSLPPLTTISSPLESNLTWRSRIVSVVREQVWEPILTSCRFIHLVVLFLPVIVCSPMLLVGHSPKRHNGENWGAIWWYDLLVGRMQAAGPTFIKVCKVHLHYVCNLK